MNVPAYHEHFDYRRYPLRVPVLTNGADLLLMKEAGDAAHLVPIRCGAGGSVLNGFAASAPAI